MLNKLVIILLSLIAFQKVSHASHIMGGEITWACAGSNTYQFNLVIYRDCNGQDITQTTLNLDVWNHPTVSSIPCQLIQTIDLSPECTEVTSGPTALSCGSGSLGGNGAGAIQKFIFQSDPVTLSGTPPEEGWSFTYDDWSRSWTLTNIQTPQNYGITLSATMFAIPNATAGQCVDSSPHFEQDPYLITCTGTDYAFNSNVTDPDNDSLVFSWGEPLDHFPSGSFNPPTNPLTVPFVSGFSYDNPTPDTNLDPNNIPASINPTTGEIQFRSYNAGEYVVVQKIESYRDGILISRTYREVQIVVIDCNGNNTAPQITPPFNANTSFEAQFMAGDIIDFDIIIADNELLQDGTPQTVTLIPTGNEFPSDLTSANGDCDIQPCATLDQAPIIMGTQGLNTHFHWETDCAHLVDASGNQQSEQTYYFVLKATDDYCTVPGLTYETIKITLKNSDIIPAVDLNCVNVLPSGDVELNWSVPTTTATGFSAYEIYSVQDGLIATLTNITENNYTHIGANANAGLKTYYIKTKYGCNGLNESVSDTLNSIYMDLNDLGDGRISLTWNLTSDPMNNGDELTQNIMREYPAGTWTLRAQVPYGTTFWQDTIDICDAWQNFRIEIPNDAGCISGSNIDGDQLQDIINPYIPTINAVSVDTTTGAMQISWNQNQSADTYGYIIYQNINGFWESIDTVYGITTTTYLNFNTNSTSEAETYGVAAFDSCMTNTVPANYQTSALSGDHTSIYLSNELNICDRIVTLNWTNYSGWINGKEIDHYELIAKAGNSNYDIIESFNPGTNTYSHQNLTQNITYYYYIRAVANDGTIAYSNRSDRFIVPPSPPNFHYLSKASVELSEEIEVECYTDPTASVQGYELYKKGPLDSDFDYVTTMSQSSTNFISYFDSDVKLSRGAYEYQIAVIDSCGNTGQVSNIAQTVFLEVSTQDIEMKATLAWTDYSGFDGNIIQYNVYRGVNGIFESTPIAVLSPNIRAYVDDLSAYYESEGEFCYRVEAVESVNSYGFSKSAFSNPVCVAIEPLVYIPNAFTINGPNPIFLPVISLFDFESYQLNIYNRWGEVIYFTDDRYLGWDGRGMDGDLKAEGTYVYVLRFENELGEPFEFMGTVTLLYSDE